MSNLSKKTWDRHAILAEIKRRGMTLERLAVESGMHKNSCKTALGAPYPKADRVISKFLEMPLHELWPDRYHVNGDRILPQNKANMKMNVVESKNELAA